MRCVLDSTLSSASKIVVPATGVGESPPTFAAGGGQDSSGLFQPLLVLASVLGNLFPVHVLLYPYVENGKSEDVLQCCWCAVRERVRSEEGETHAARRKTAIVTGAGRGIGEAIALALARRRLLP